jgi:hypothetical protein
MGWQPLRDHWYDRAVPRFQALVDRCINASDIALIHAAALRSIHEGGLVTRARSHGREMFLLHTYHAVYFMFLPAAGIGTCGRDDVSLTPLILRSSAFWRRTKVCLLVFCFNPVRAHLLCRISFSTVLPVRPGFLSHLDSEILRPRRSSVCVMGADGE